MDERFDPWRCPYEVEGRYVLLDDVEVHMPDIDDVDHTTLLLLLPEVEIL